MMGCVYNGGPIDTLLRDLTAMSVCVTTVCDVHIKHFSEYVLIIRRHTIKYLEAKTSIFSCCSDVLVCTSQSCTLDSHENQN
jgi:hypothetical protein